VCRDKDVGVNRIFRIVRVWGENRTGHHDRGEQQVAESDLLSHIGRPDSPLIDP